MSGTERGGGGNWGDSLTGVVTTVAGQARITFVAAGEVEVRSGGVAARKKVVRGPGVLLGPAGAVGDAGIGAIHGIRSGCHGLDFVG